MSLWGLLCSIVRMRLTRARVALWEHVCSALDYADHWAHAHYGDAVRGAVL